ncbi:MAG: tetratricopeptide repeat protein [Candidatus Njordarchaeia archaeon]
MYLWRWLSDFKWRSSNLLINLGKVGGEYEILHLLLSHHQNLGRLYENELIKRLKNIIQNADDFPHADLIKYLGFALLGKIEFEKNLLPVALNHFEEAYKNFQKLDFKDPDEEARLKAWIGLVAFKLGDYKKAQIFFTSAIRHLEEKGRETKKPIIGELKALLADALFFSSPNEAIQESEYAHEILKEYISPFLISNAIKLGTGLIVRGYIDDGYSVIREGLEKIPEVVKMMNISFIKTLKFLEGNSKKAIFYIEPKNESSMKNLLISFEALKGIYYTFRRIVKPNIDSRRLLTFNSKIVSLIRKMNKLEEIMSLKNSFLNKTEMIGIFTISDYPIYTIEQKINQLSKTFGEVSILSFIANEKPQEYRITLYRNNGLGEKIISKVVEIDDGILESRYMAQEEASSFIANYIPLEVLNEISNIEKDTLMIISPTKNLFSVPWELIPYQSKEMPYLGLSLATVFIPSLMDITFWEREVHPSSNKKFYIETDKERRGVSKKVENILQKIGYWRNDKLERDLIRDLTAEVSIFIYMNKTLETPDGDMFIKIGKSYLSALDLERMKFRGNLAILDAPCCLESFIDDYGAHNLTISLILSGFKSVIGYLGEGSDDKKFADFLEKLVLNEKQFLFEGMLYAKRELFNNNKQWWHYTYFGNPMIIL